MPELLEFVCPGYLNQKPVKGLKEVTAGLGPTWWGWGEEV
jgi:hypothetical protein